MSHLPTFDEISVYGSLDEQCAVDHFLGKDLAEAEALFRDNFIYYQEDLMWMGPSAFCFYVDAAINYLLALESEGDSDAASSFCGVVEFQNAHYAASISPAYARLRSAIDRILRDFDRYDCDPNIYGDVPKRYRELRAKLV